LACEINFLFVASKEWLYVIPLLQGHLLLDLSNSKTGVKSLGAGLGAVHDGVAAVQGEGVLKSMATLGSELVSAINHPAVSLHQDGGSEVLVRVPPVRGARCGTASAKNTLVKTIQLLAILNRLQVLTFGLGSLLLQERLNRLVLSIKLCQIRNEILDNVGVGQGVDLCGFAVNLDFANASQGVTTTNVHGAGSADTLAARATEGQGGIDLVLDFDQCIKDHGSAVLHVDLVRLQLGLLSRLVRVPSVDLEGLDLPGGCLRGKGASSNHGNRREAVFQDGTREAEGRLLGEREGHCGDMECFSETVERRVERKLKLRAREGRGGEEVEVEVDRGWGCQRDEC
jgi:hypothetical protein